MSEGFGSPRHYPVPCPACGALAGYPTLVQTLRSRPGHIRIDLSCHECKEQWSQEADIESR